MPDGMLGMPAAIAPQLPPTSGWLFGGSVQAPLRYSDERPFHPGVIRSVRGALGRKIHSSSTPCRKTRGRGCASGAARLRAVTTGGGRVSASASITGWNARPQVKSSPAVQAIASGPARERIDPVRPSNAPRSTSVPSATTKNHPAGERPGPVHPHVDPNIQVFKYLPLFSMERVA